MIRVLIADDHKLVREGLRRILAEAAGVLVVGEATTGDEILATVEQTRPDVLLLDIRMPGRGFLEILKELKQRHGRVRAVMLSAYGEEEYAIRALRAGAAGYLTKERSPEELIEAVRLVTRGQRYVSQTLAQRLASQLAGGREGAPHEQLSDREHEVLRLIGAGKSVKEIAAALRLSPKTVSTYRTRILEKLRLKTTADLIRYALEQGLR